MSYQNEPKAIYPDHQVQAPYEQQPVHSPPNYQQPFPQPDQQQQYHQYQQSPQPQFQQYPSYQEHHISTPPQAVTAQPISPQPVQPSPQPQMEQKTATKTIHQTGAWEYDMCGCFGDMGKCCTSCWCPCMTYGKIQHRLRNNDMSTYSNCNGHCWAFCGLACCGFQWVLGMMQRGEIRHTYSLDGSGCGDCCRHFWCECCVLVQEDRETEVRKSLLQASQPGYQPQVAMSYSAQQH